MQSPSEEFPASHHHNAEDQEKGILISAVMPCLNEEQTLKLCIEKAQACFKRLQIKGEVVISDNGSTDKSVEIAQSCGARVVHQSVKGYGAAILKGIEAAEGTYVMIGDADDSYDWSKLDAFISKLNEGFELVIGNRFKGGIKKGAMPPLHRYLGNPVLSVIAKVIYRAPIGDFHCGLRGFRKSIFQELHLTTTGMEFATEMIANAAIQGIKIAEVPTKLHQDGRNRPPHLRSFRDGWRHLKFIFTYAPDYLYLLPALLILIPGITLTILLTNGPIEIANFYIGIHFLALSSLLTITGINIFHFGVLAKIILRQQLPSCKSILTDIAQHFFTLEKGLLIAIIPLTCGITIDTFLLYTWTTNEGSPMENTVHLGFVATTLIVVGLNLFFSSFLINMISRKQNIKLDVS